MLFLQWDDVDFEGGFLRIASGRDGHRTKSGKGRWVPMTSRLKQIMKVHFARFRFAQYDGCQTPWVFHHELSRRSAAAGDRIRSLRSSLKGAAKRAELPADFHQHDLRHRRITTWLAEGKNPVHVKEAVGHADLRTTMSYTHLAREHLKSLGGAAHGGRDNKADVRGHVGGGRPSPVELPRVKRLHRHFTGRDSWTDIARPAGQDAPILTLAKPNGYTGIQLALWTGPYYPGNP